MNSEINAGLKALTVLFVIAFVAFRVEGASKRTVESGSTSGTERSDSSFNVNVWKDLSEVNSKALLAKVQHLFPISLQKLKEEIFQSSFDVLGDLQSEIRSLMSLRPINQHHLIIRDDAAFLQNEELLNWINKVVLNRKRLLQSLSILLESGILGFDDKNITENNMKRLRWRHIVDMKKLKSMDKNVKKLREKNHALTSALNTESAARSGTQQEVKNLKDMLKNHDTRKEVQEQIDEKTQTISDLNSKIDELKRKLSAAEEAKVSSNKHSMLLISELEKSKKSLEDNFYRMDVHNQVMAVVLHKTLQEKKKELLVSANSALDRATEEFNALLTKLSISENIGAETRKQIEDKTHNIAEFKSIIQNLERNLIAAEEANKRSIQLISESEKTLEDAKTEHSDNLYRLELENQVMTDILLTFANSAANEVKKLNNLLGKMAEEKQALINIAKNNRTEMQKQIDEKAHIISDLDSIIKNLERHLIVAENSNRRLMELISESEKLLEDAKTDHGDNLYRLELTNQVMEVVLHETLQEKSHESFISANIALDHATEELNALRRKLHVFESVGMEMQKKIMEKSHTISDLNTIIKNLERNLTVAEEANKRSMTLISESEKRLEDAKADHSDNLYRLEVKNQVMTDILLVFANSTATEVKKLNALLNQMVEEKHVLLNIVKEMQKQINEKTDTISELHLIIEKLERDLTVAEEFNMRSMQLISESEKRLEDAKNDHGDDLYRLEVENQILEVVLKKSPKDKKNESLTFANPILNCTPEVKQEAGNKLEISDSATRRDQQRLQSAIEKLATANATVQRLQAILGNTTSSQLAESKTLVWYEVLFGNEFMRMSLLILLLIIVCGSLMAVVIWNRRNIPPRKRRPDPVSFDFSDLEWNDCFKPPTI